MAVAAAVALVTATGCSGGGSAGTTPTTSSRASVPTSLPQRGGLVGVIDSARLVAVCMNVRELSTLVEAAPAATVNSLYDGVVEALRQPPAPPASLRLATRWDRWRHEVQLTVAVHRMERFCAREHS